MDSGGHCCVILSNCCTGIYYQFNISISVLVTMTSGRVSYITLDMPQYFACMLAAVADATDAKLSDLPAVLIFDFGNCHFKLVAHTCHDRFDDLPLIFQRMTPRQM